MGAGSAAGTAQRLFSDWAVMPRLGRRYDVVHYPSFPPSPLACRGKSPAVVYTLHDITWWLYPETSSRGGRHYYRRLAERALGSADVVLTDSQAARADIVERFALDASRVRVVYPGVSVPQVGSDVSGTTKPFLLVVGTVEPRKNLDRLFAAYRGSGLTNDIDLVVVGRQGWGALPPGVVLRSDLDDTQLDSLYRQAIAVVIPSLYEGFGLPVVEAMARGCPVVCSDIPVFREVTGGRATFFDPYSTDAMVTSLREVAEGVEPAADAREWASQFTWDRTVQQCWDAYEVAVG
jgi:glycosyltransferase involved in cell wall biosynthesis